MKEKNKSNTINIIIIILVITISIICMVKFAVIPLINCVTNIKFNFNYNEVDRNEITNIPPDKILDSKEDNEINLEIRPEVKQILDDYETLSTSFFELIKKYENSNNSDKEVLTNLKGLSSDLIDIIEQINNLEDKEEVRDKEIIYYLKGKLKVIEKLIELAE